MNETFEQTRPGLGNLTSFSNLNRQVVRFSKFLPIFRQNVRQVQIFSKIQAP